MTLKQHTLLLLAVFCITLEFGRRLLADNMAANKVRRVTTLISWQLQGVISRSLSLTRPIKCHRNARHTHQSTNSTFKPEETQFRQKEIKAEDAQKVRQP